MGLMRRASGCYVCLALACCFQLATAFLQPATGAAAFTKSALCAEANANRSRLAGNQREPTPHELQVMDEMIVKLANAKPYELPTSVQRAFRVISSPRFFVRIAELTDQANDVERDKLVALASNLVATLEAVVSSAQEKLEENAKDVEMVVTAASEPATGEFLVPLSTDRIRALQRAMGALDAASFQGDAFVSTVDAWMNKSHLDGMDGMVTILQTVLQLYAGRRILEVRRLQRQGETDGVSAMMDELLQTDSDQWDTMLRPMVTNQTVKASLIAEIQASMETIVLSLESGSMSQRVLAEYLQEMVKRVESVPLL